MTKKRIHTIYGIVLSAAAAIAGICLIVACIGIYRSGGESPFNANSVAAAFQNIAIPVYLFTAIAIGGFILDIFWPIEKPKAPVPKQYDTILQKLHAKLDLQNCPAAFQVTIRNEQKLRKILAWITLGILALCSVLFLCYGLNIQNFPKGEETASVKAAMWYFIPCLAIPFGFAIFSAYQQKRSILREIGLVKSALKEASRPAESAPAATENKKWMFGIRCGILALAIFLIVFGFINRGYVEVIAKAAAICRECVGLG